MKTEILKVIIPEDAVVASVLFHSKSQYGIAEFKVIIPPSDNEIKTKATELRARTTPYIFDIIDIVLWMRSEIFGEEQP